MKTCIFHLLINTLSALLIGTGIEKKRETDENNKTIRNKIIIARMITTIKVFTSTIRMYICT